MAASRKNFRLLTTFSQVPVAASSVMAGNAQRAAAPTDRTARPQCSLVPPAKHNANRRSRVLPNPSFNPDPLRQAL